MKFNFVGQIPGFLLAACVVGNVCAERTTPRRAVVSVRATVPLATEPGDQPGVFTITRGGSTNSEVTIPYLIGGSASNGVDYAAIPSSVTLLAGQISANISIAPINEPTATRYKTAVLTLRRARTNDFAIGYPNRAEVFLVYNYTNLPPAVKIVSPTNDSLFLSLPNIAISALAGDSNGWVTSVEFFANGSSVGLATNTAPGPSPLVGLLNREERNARFPASSWQLHSRFLVVWSNVPPGAYALTAVATDNAGEQKTSATVNLTVSTNLPSPQTRILTPSDGSEFLVGAPINILAEAGESGGVVNTVEFFGDGNSLGVVTNMTPVARPHPAPPYLSWRPYFFRWTNEPTGSNTLFTIATDANGSQATSAVVNINVRTNFPHHRRW